MSRQYTHTIGFKTLYLGIILAAAFSLVQPVSAAASPQVCTVSKKCSIGEFLYDDSYAPITNATCTFTARNPDGTIYINATSLTSTADGWYAHEFTTPTTEGVYRSQICCTADSDYLCIDKSFEANTDTSLTQNDVSKAVWDASKSSHTTPGSFGAALQQITPSTTEVASAVWGYSGRTLSGFSSLVTDIWASATRTLTSESLSSGSLATKGDIKGVEQTSTTKVEQTQQNVQEIRYMLERQINKPIIENSMEDSARLQSKLKTTQEKAKNLYFSLSQTHQSLTKLKKSWSLLSQVERLESVNGLIASIGEPSDTSKKETIFGATNWFVDQWDFAISKTAANNVEDLYRTLKQTQRQLASEKLGIVFFPQRALNASVLLKVNIGEVGDDENASSLFGEINQTTQLAADLDGHNAKITETLKAWKKMAQTDKQKTVINLNRDILALNQIPQVSAIIAQPARLTDKELHNKILFLNGLVKANKAYLAHSSQKTFVSTWLELGSITFKTLITNPSSLIAQAAEVKYYLPKEVKKADIIEVDEGLAPKFDEQKSQYYVAGKFELAPNDSKIVSVRVSDVWTVPDRLIQSLKSQAEALMKPLEKTSYFAQGVTIKSDIDVGLDKIKLRESQAETPEAKIEAYREAEIELRGIEVKMERLKELAAQASSTGSLFGFVGATQTLAVWGLIIVISTGFVFLTIYMRKLTGDLGVKQEEVKPQKTKKKEAQKVTSEQKSIRLHPNMLVFAGIIAYGVTTASISSAVTYYWGVHSRVPVQVKVLGTQSPKTQQSCPNQEVKGASANVKEPKLYATVTETPTGWLRVRKSPSGIELDKVDVGKTFPLIEETHAWLKIKLDNDTEGWISRRYALVDSSQNGKAAE